MKAFIVFQYITIDRQTVRQYFTKCYSETHLEANECFLWYLRERFSNIELVNYCIQEIEYRAEEQFLFPIGDILLVSVKDFKNRIFETSWEGVNYA